MTDPTIELAEDGSVKMLRVADPEVREVLVPIQEDDTLEEPTTLDVIARLTEEELEEEFNKLSASDKIRYNQWVEFQEHYQRMHGIAGMSSQNICFISDMNKPAIPTEIAKEELANVDTGEEQVQIVKMVDKDGKMVKKVKPILIKKELDREHATIIPFWFLSVPPHQWSTWKRSWMMKTIKKMMKSSVLRVIPLLWRAYWMMILKPLTP